MTTQPKHTPTPELYYIRNKDAGYLGNSFIWWGLRSSGYTAYINGAQRYTLEEAEKICNGNPEKNIKYKCADIDARMHLIFDGQDAGCLGTDEPCGWRGGYVNVRALNSHDALVEALEEVMSFYSTRVGTGSNHLRELDSARSVLALAKGE